MWHTWECWQSLQVVMVPHLAHTILDRCSSTSSNDLCVLSSNYCPWCQHCNAEFLMEISKLPFTLFALGIMTVITQPHEVSLLEFSGKFSYFWGLLGFLTLSPTLGNTIERCLHGARPNNNSAGVHPVLVLEHFYKCVGNQLVSGHTLGLQDTARGDGMLELVYFL